MKARPGDGSGYAALLEQLRRSRSELERFPPSSYTHVAILAIALPITLGTFVGIIPAFVPPYVLLPFVLLPGWRVFEGERERRRALQSVTAQIRIVEERLGDGGAPSTPPPPAPPSHA